jgi:hypothetical protein
MAYGTVNADVIGTSVAGSNLGAGNASIMKNRIINGAMVIDQRNAGASVTPSSGASYTLDRAYVFASQASKFSVQQNAGSVTPPVGFTNYLGIISLSAYSIGSTEAFVVGQPIEGYNVADLAWGTVNAKTVTLSFQVYSSLTGTFGGSIRNAGNTRSYPFTYSIPAANTWTQISITITGDTTGTWLTTNGIGMYLFFGLGVGSTNSGTAGAWSSNNYASATGATSVVGTSGATFYITGVQLEVGSSATGFEYRQYGQELALCQRYYEKSFDVDVSPGNGVDGVSLKSSGFWAGMSSNTGSSCQIPFKVSKRTNPTITAYGNSSGYWNANASWSVNAFTGISGSNTNSFFMQQQVTAGVYPTFGHWTASAEL